MVAHPEERGFAVRRERLIFSFDAAAREIVGDMAGINPAVRTSGVPFVANAFFEITQIQLLNTILAGSVDLYASAAFSGGSAKTTPAARSRRNCPVEFSISTSLALAAAERQQRDDEPRHDGGQKKGDRTQRDFHRPPPLRFSIPMMPESKPRRETGPGNKKGADRS